MALPTRGGGWWWVGPWEAGGGGCAAAGWLRVVYMAGARVLGGGLHVVGAGFGRGKGGGAEGKLCHAIITTARTAILARYYYCSSTRHAVISKARCELCGRQAKPRVIHHHHWS